MKKVLRVAFMTLMMSSTMIITYAQCVNTSCNGSSNTGLYSSAIGYKTNSTGDYSFSSGYKSSATGWSSTALGDSSIANGNFSFAAGYRSSTAKLKSFAIGEYCQTTQLQSYAIGQNCIANATASLAIGRYMQTNASGAIAFGSSSAYGYMINSIPNSLMIGFNSTVPTFYVGPSPSYQSYGKVGIGTTNPQTTLHVAGDVTISTLTNTTGNMVLTTDKTGKLMLTTGSGGGGGDNMGNCEATRNVLMHDFSIQNNSFGGKAVRLDGSFFNPGLRFTNDNNMVMENTKVSSLNISSSPEGTSSVWVGNWKSGGFGLVKNGDSFTGGIYWDGNNPQPILNFNATKVGIGIMPPMDGKYNLYVTGGILTEEIKVQLAGGPDWPDYVFASDYKLNTLQEVEQYIAKNQHLPDVPSAETVKKEGINVGEMNALLLQKIEELTLYTIQLEKKYNELESRLNTSSLK